MNLQQIAATILIVTGILGLVYGGFSYTKETHEANIGPIEMTIEDNNRVTVPLWLSIGAVVAGAGILIYPSLRR